SRQVMRIIVYEIFCTLFDTHLRKIFTTIVHFKILKKIGNVSGNRLPYCRNYGNRLFLIDDPAFYKQCQRISMRFYSLPEKGDIEGVDSCNVHSVDEYCPWAKYFF